MQRNHAMYSGNYVPEIWRLMERHRALQIMLGMAEGADYHVLDAAEAHHEVYNILDNILEEEFKKTLEGGSGDRRSPIEVSRELYIYLKKHRESEEFRHDVCCPFCLSISEVIKAGRDALTFAHKKGDVFIMDRWYCGACDKHFYTDFKDTD